LIVLLLLVSLAVGGGGGCAEFVGIIAMNSAHPDRGDPTIA
jgi:hypothetical protein